MSWNSFTPYRMESSDRSMIAGITIIRIGYRSYSILGTPSSSVIMMMRRSIQIIMPTADGARMNNSSVLLIE